MLLPLLRLLFCHKINETSHLPFLPFWHDQPLLWYTFCFGQNWCHFCLSVTFSSGPTHLLEFYKFDQKSVIFQIRTPFLFPLKLKQITRWVCASLNLSPLISMILVVELKKKCIKGWLWSEGNKVTWVSAMFVVVVSFLWAQVFSISSFPPLPGKH